MIPPSNYLLQPYNDGPPYRWIELRRDLNSSFGNNPTPQQDILITGLRGFWDKQIPVGQLASTIVDPTSNVIISSISSGAGPGVGDVLIIDSERMLVTDADFTTTGQSFASGCTTAAQNDNTMLVANASTLFSKEEVVQIDSEWMKILSISGNNMIMKRAWDGSILTTHSAGPILARRALTVVRGALGTTATSHANNAAMSIQQIPGLIKTLSLAESVVELTQEPGAFANDQQRTWYGQAQRGQGSNREAFPGPGLPDIRERAQSQFGRQVRSAVV